MLNKIIMSVLNHLESHYIDKAIAANLSYFDMHLNDIHVKELEVLAARQQEVKELLNIIEVLGKIKIEFSTKK